MSSRFHKVTRAAALSAMLALCSQALAQSDDVDPEVRIQQLENQIRQLTGQNEELQFRNRQLEERLRTLQGAQMAPAGQSAPLQPNVAALPPAQPSPSVRPPQAQGSFEPQIAAPAPIGAPGGRVPGEPLDLANTGAAAGNPAGALPPQRNANATGALTTLPPSATPRDEFDLGVGYMQRKDYALAEETMRNFVKRYPSDPLIAEAQFWLGESFFQRQLYRDAAESFLGVTTKFDRSAKAPDALLRLGQSLAALKEKEAACAAFGEVGRKYPRTSSSIKQAVDREQKRERC